MSKYISHEKYEKLKAAANSRMKESQILKNKLETIPELEEEIIHLEEENKKLKDVLNNGTFESDMLSALKNDNKKIKEKMIIKKLKRKWKHLKLNKKICLKV
jgi:glycerol-3-phosphate responsive antiterminator